MLALVYKKYDLRTVEMQHYIDPGQKDGSTLCVEQLTLFYFSGLFLNLFIVGYNNLTVEFVNSQHFWTPVLLNKHSVLCAVLTDYHVRFFF